MAIEKIDSIEAMKQYFSESETPHYFVSATNFNLMNMEQWVKRWTPINFIDCFDGSNDSILIPSVSGAPVLDSIESINSFLLGHKQVVEHIQDRDAASAAAEVGGSSDNKFTGSKFENDKFKSSQFGSKSFDKEATEKGERGKAVFLFFDKELEQTCEALGLDICLPPNELVKDIDNKITTTEIGNEAGVGSVPNALEHVDSYESLRVIADKNKLGSDLVVQTAFGDSGKTTFFISNQSDYDAVADQIVCEDKVKIMKRIRCAGTAIEGCATASGTFVAPLLSELIGFEELTPYQGGWCGNELYENAFSADVRRQAAEMTERLGDALYERGYHGYFEVDYLIDLDSGELYLGELNPRITGISAMTNMSNYAYDTVPLFLFHLLEYSDVECAIDPAAYNKASYEQGAKAISSQLIFKYTEKSLRIITEAPVSGVYVLDNGELTLKQADYDRRHALAENEVFLMRIMSEGEYAYKGGDLAIIFANKILKTPQESLSDDAVTLIKALHNSFQYRELTEGESALVERYNAKSSLKSSAVNESEEQ